MAKLSYAVKEIAKLCRSEKEQVRAKNEKAVKETRGTIRTMLIAMYNVSLSDLDDRVDKEFNIHGIGRECFGGQGLKTGIGFCADFVEGFISKLTKNAGAADSLATTVASVWKSELEKPIKKMKTKNLEIFKQVSKGKGSQDMFEKILKKCVDETVAELEELFKRNDPFRN